MSTGTPPPTDRPPQPQLGETTTRPASTTARPPETEDVPSTWQPLLWLKLILLLAVIAYTIAFVVQNTDKIPIDFVFTTARVHLIWEILLLLAIGVLGGVLLSQLYRRNARRGLRKNGAKSRDAGRDLGRRDEAVRKPR